MKKHPLTLICLIEVIIQGGITLVFEANIFTLCNFAFWWIALVICYHVNPDFK